MTAPAIVRIPADVDRPDRLIAGLTARQLLWLGAGGLLIAVLWTTAASWLPLPVVGVVAAPLVAGLVLMVWGRYDGLDADRLVLAWWRHTRNPRHLVPAAEGVPAVPWGFTVDAPSPLELPVGDIEPAGLLDLGGEGAAVLCRASSVNFGLRTDAEQRALVATIGRWLNSLTAPFEIVVRAERVDLSSSTAGLRVAAPALPHPALEAAAVAHAEFLEELTARQDVLRRSVFLVFREPSGSPDAAAVLARRVEDATRALGVAGIRVEPLDSDAATAAIGRAIEPASSADRRDGDHIVLGAPL